jgi:hypothetical protein
MSVDSRVGASRTEEKMNGTASSGRGLRAIRGRAARSLLAATAALAGCGVFVSAAEAIEFKYVGARVHQSMAAPTPGATVPFGAPVRQAGAHPDVTFEYRLPPEAPEDPTDLRPVEQSHRVLVDLPPGLVGNPLATPRCPESGLKAAPNGNGAVCPVASQVGTVDLLNVHDGYASTNVPVFNVEPRTGTPGQFAFNFSGTVVRLTPTVRGNDFGITMDSGIVSQGTIIGGARVTIWGVPHNPIHDNRRWRNPTTAITGMAAPPSSLSGTSREPLLSLSTRCDGTADTTSVRMDGWSSIGQFAFASFDADLDGVPFVTTGCESVPFDASFDVGPTSRVADSPSGLEVDLRVPQTSNPAILATSHVKDVKMVLPVGWSVSPSSAVGLGACSPAQIGLGSTDEPTCPRSSKLGTVTVESPLVAEPLTGDVILASPYENPFGSLIALYIVAEGSGVRVKIPGRVDADPVTGRLTARFDNNPQLPFSHLRVRVDGGENASLATPTACGLYGNETEIASWSGATRDLTSSLVVDAGCGPRGFSPSFLAGSENPVAGGSSPFSLSIGREDRTEELSTIESVKLPKGLLGYVSKVSLCSDAAADAGTCGEGSRIGHVQATAGPGGAPLAVPQQGKAPTSVSLAGPYKGAPYSLSVVVPAQAGPFDLGRVVVRSPLHLDRRTAQLSTGIDVSRVFDRNGTVTQTISGAMPTIVEGIPLRIRDLRVIVDREGFTVNPTSCAPASVDAMLKSVTGQSAAVGSRFQVGECAALAFTPRLGMRLTGKGRTRTGAHPGLTASLRQSKGQANIAKARVTLPKSVVLDPNNSTDPALVCDYDKGLAADCPASSIVGEATARTPLLAKPLTGDVHLVQGIRFGPTGNRIRTTPSLLVKLRGEVEIDLRGQTTVRNNRLVTTFGQVPDAPVSRFDIKINGGAKGILVITRTRKAKINLCAKPSSHSAGVALNGQNGKRAGFATKVKTPCKTKAAKKAKQTKTKKK